MYCSDYIAVNKSGEETSRVITKLKKIDTETPEKDVNLENNPPYLMGQTVINSLKIITGFLPNDCCELTSLKKSLVVSNLTALLAVLSSDEKELENISEEEWSEIFNLIKSCDVLKVFSLIGMCSIGTAAIQQM